MDKTKIKKYQIFSVVFTIILGILLHFTYQLSEKNQLVALFSAINESVWEHLKLVFFPMMITTIFGKIYFGKNLPNFLCSKVIGIISSMLFMVIFFYTYSGIIGKNLALIDITSLLISVLLGEYVSYKLIVSYFKCNNKFYLFILIILTILFIVFTFYQPNLGIFIDPLVK